jgi:hypothetical protein
MAKESGINMVPESNLRRCFLSASAAINIHPLVKLLEEYNVHVSTGFNRKLNNIYFAVEDEIDKCDFMCAIISKKSSPNVFFEIGIARGARKPIFLIVENNEDLPTYLKDIIYVRASANDLNIIKYSLEIFLSNYKPIAKSEPIIESNLKLDRALLQEKIEEINRSLTASEIESSVFNLFKSFSDIIIVNRIGHDAGVDMSLWIDDLETTIGNPILVEIKSGQLSYDRLLSAENQIRKYAKRTNSPLGILIYHDKKGQSFEHLENIYPLVIWLELNKLTNRLSNESLAQIIKSERNKICHKLTEA